MPSILLVDDSGLFRGAAEEVLKRTGCETLTASGRHGGARHRAAREAADDRRQGGHRADDRLRPVPRPQGGPGLRAHAHRDRRPGGLRRRRAARRRGRHAPPAARSGGLLRRDPAFPAGRAPRRSALGGRVVDHVLARRDAAHRHHPRPVPRRLLRPHHGASAHRRAHRRVVRRPGRARRQDRRRRGHRRAPRPRERPRPRLPLLPALGHVQAEPRGMPPHPGAWRRSGDTGGPMRA